VKNCILPFTSEDKVITVLDPFMGCGTTGMVCRDLGMDFVGIEIDEGYYNISQERINNELDKINNNIHEISETKI
jgi:DNA modification methylase